MSQASVLSDVPSLGPEGSLNNAYPHAILGDKIANTDIPFGRVCVYKTASGSPFADLPTATEEITDGTALGISLWDPVLEQQDIPGTATAKYLEGQPIAIARKGMVTVLCETTCVEGAPVFVRFADGTVTDNYGAVRNDADTQAGPVDTAVELPGAVFRTTLTAPGKCVVELNIP